LDLQLPLQAVPITVKVVSSNPVHGEVYSIKHYVIDKVCGSASDMQAYKLISFYKIAALVTFVNKELML
jgi:hypothetical protein